MSDPCPTPPGDKSRALRVGVVVNRSKEGAIGLLEELRAYGRARSRIEFVLEDRSADLIDAEGMPLDQMVEEVDLMLVAGGDGSLLELARQVYPAPVPILGVNIGSLGFLTSLAARDILHALPLIERGELVPSPRLALQATVHRGDDKTVIPCALNDVVVSRGDLSRLVHIRVEVGEKFVTEYVCDGLIVCTPTGSTAYSVSAGGPMMSPGARALALTPVAPHTLTNRSLVVGTRETIRVEIPAQRSNPVLQADGMPAGELSPGDWVEIKPAEKPVVLAYTPDRDFYSILREKLKWSGANV